MTAIMHVIAKERSDCGDLVPAKASVLTMSFQERRRPVAAARLGGIW